MVDSMEPLSVLNHLSGIRTTQRKKRDCTAGPFISFVTGSEALASLILTNCQWPVRSDFVVPAAFALSPSN